MDRQFYYVEELTNDNGIKWSRLLDYVINKAEIIEFAIADDKKSVPLVESLQLYLVERFASRWRWQHRQHNETKFVRFRLAPEIKTFLQSVSTLRDWRLLEDPTFYRGDIAIMWTISHESTIFILLDEHEALTLRTEGFLLKEKIEYKPPLEK